MSTATAAQRSALAQRLDELAGSYTFVSRLLLASPDPDLLARIRQPGLMAGWPLADADSRAGAELLVRGAEADVLTLARDHQALFIGPGPLLAPPYESVHRSRDHLLFEEVTFEVRAAYRAYARVAPALNKEPDDHLGLELDFLAHLCVRALDGLDAGDEDATDAALAAQQSFLTEHTLIWGPECLRLVREHATTDFYRGAGLLGTGLLAHARDVLVGD
jgi:TorA maturation chaperone TorD